MASTKIADLFNTLESTRNTLLSATKGDGMLSRADFKALIQNTKDDNKSRFLALFYHFLIKLENRPKMRVTEEVIDRGLAFIQAQIIPHFEIKTEFSAETIKKISETHPSAFPIAMELIRNVQQPELLSPKEVSTQIDPLSEGLLFDDYGSEAAIAISAFFLEHPETQLSPESFAKALGVDPNTPKGKVERFDPADQVLLTFVEQHQGTAQADQAKKVAALMQDNLENLTIIVLGEDNHPDLESEHPVYVFGLGQDGNLAGFESVVIWT